MISGKIDLVSFNVQLLALAKTNELCVTLQNLNAEQTRNFVKKHSAKKLFSAKRNKN